MELVGAQCACLTSSIALLIGMLSDLNACAAGNEAALMRVLQALLLAGIPQSERALCTWPGESPFVLRILSFWTAALRIPRDIRFMRRMQQLQQPPAQSQHHAGSSDAAVDHAVSGMATQCAELMTRRLLMAVAHDLPQPEAVVAELAAAWLEACQCTDAAAAAWPAWWRAWLGEHAARFGLGRAGAGHGDQGTAAAVECIVQVVAARVADGRVRPWRDMIGALSRVLRGAAPIDAMSQHL